ncbi:NAD(P)-binding protein [Plenodomus tracheiphilus IPT5]|uniref:NAD(P)-binding protein n=1 Tax=Plenodomus tracheiphilus IPT5 TaxID=1408161 RepID=A0A6A7ANF5_9PLEO|nr:NAD(P)-binding protein [Plenodomus tracheiphilus IPT5]
MSSKEVVLVTGANTGLGYQIVRALCGSEKRYDVLIGSRSLSKADQAIDELRKEFPDSSSTLQPIQVDVESDESINSAFEQVKQQHGKLDALINNAGTQLDQQLTSGTMDIRTMWNKSYDVNVTGTHILTNTFIPLLLLSSSPRLLFIASGTSSLTGAENLNLFFNAPPAAGWPKENIKAYIPAYRCSKTGLNMLMREWYRVLKEDGVKVWGVSPGYLATGLGGNQEANVKAGAGDPALGGRFVLDVLEGGKDAEVGRVVGRQGVQDW